MTYTHIGRDVIATGSDRRASRIAGLNTDRVIIGVFAASGASAALAGVLLSYSLGAASPVALADVLAPAAAARHRRRRLGGRRPRQPDGNRGRRAHALHLALGPERHRRLAACA